MHTQLLSTLRPILESLDADRRVAARKMWKIGLLTAAATAGLIPLVLLFGSEDLFKAAFVAPLFGMALAGMERKKFATSFKEKVLARVVAARHPGLTYEAGGSLSRQEVDQTGLFLRKVDKLEGEDLVKGMLGKTAMRFSEVRAMYTTTHTGKQRRKYTKDHTVFRGLVFRADFNKNFTGSTYVLPDQAERWLGSFGQTLQSWTASHGELVKLEDPEFERAFAVYGGDPIEARYILSPALMRRLLDFRNKTGLQPLIAFKDEYISVAIPMKKNLFEPRITKSLLDSDALSHLFAELDLFTGLVEDLHLNNRIWTKR